VRKLVGGIIVNGREGCGGAMVVERRFSRARIFWHRAETSRSVLSSVGSVAKDLESDAREDVRAVRR